jgi:hypothetical protein
MMLMCSWNLFGILRSSNILKVYRLISELCIFRHKLHLILLESEMNITQANGLNVMAEFHGHQGRPT